MALASLGIVVNSTQVAAATKMLQGLRREGETLTQRMERLRGGFVKANTAASNFGRSIKSLVGGFLTFEAARRAFNRIVDFENALVKVKATANLTVQELANLKTAILEIGRELPVTTTQLLEIARASAALGVHGVGNILAYTKAVAILGTASELAGENAVLHLGRIQAATGESAAGVQVLAEAIASLGIESAAQAPEIAHMALRITQATAAFKVSSLEAVGLGTAMRTVGIVAELGGSSIGRTLKLMETAAAKGGLTLEFFADISGIAKEEFKEAFGADQIGVLVKFLDGLGKLKEAGVASTIALHAVGIEGIRDFQVLNPLAKNIDLVRKYLNLASDAAHNHAVSQRLASEQANTLRGSLIRLSNLWTALLVKQEGVDSGLHKIVDTIIQMVAIFARMDNAWNMASSTAKAFALAIEEVYRGLKDMAVGLGQAFVQLFNDLSILAGYDVKFKTAEDSANSFARAFRLGVAVVIASMQALELSIFKMIDLVADLALKMDDMLHPLSDRKTMFAMHEGMVKLAKDVEIINKQEGQGAAFAAVDANIEKMKANIKEMNAIIVESYQGPLGALGGIETRMNAGTAIDQYEKWLKGLERVREQIKTGQPATFEDIFELSGWQSFASEAKSRTTEILGDRTYTEILDNLHKRMMDILKEDPGKEMADKFNKGFENGLFGRMGQASRTIQGYFDQFVEGAKEGAARLARVYTSEVYDEIEKGARFLAPVDFVVETRTAGDVLRVLIDTEKKVELLGKDIGSALVGPQKEALETLVVDTKRMLNELAHEWEDPALGATPFDPVTLQAYNHVLGLIVGNLAKIKGLAPKPAVPVESLADRVIREQEEKFRAGKMSEKEKEAFFRQSEKQAYRDRINEILTEINALEKLDAQKEIDIEFEKVRVAALQQKGGKKLTPEEEAYFREIYKAKLVKASDRAFGQAVQERIDGLRAEAEGLLLTNDEMERYIELQGMVTEVTRKGLPVNQALVERLNRELETIQKLTRLRELFQSIGEAAGSAFEDIIVGAKDAKEALLDLLQEVTRLVVHQLVTRKIVDFITTLGTNLFAPTSKTTGPPAVTTAIDPRTLQPVNPLAYAHGGAFNMVAAANGLIDRLTYIPMAGGKVAKTGESGPEALIAPLARAPGGRLGIEYVGGGGGGSDRRVFNINVSISGIQGTPDGIRRAGGQVADQVRRVVMRGR